jgi:hypothetical protein
MASWRSWTVDDVFECVWKDDVYRFIFWSFLGFSFVVRRSSSLVSTLVRLVASSSSRIQSHLGMIRAFSSFQKKKTLPYGSPVSPFLPVRRYLS